MENQILELLQQLNNKIENMDKKIDSHTESLNEINRKLDSIYDQTADLTEFRTEMIDKTNEIVNDTQFIKHKLNRTEEDVFSIQNHLKLIK